MTSQTDGPYIYRWLWPEEVAQRYMLHLACVEEMIASGELPSILLPGNGPVVPLALLPPYRRLTEHEA